MIQSHLSQDKKAKYDLYSLAADYYDIEGTEGLTSSELWTEAMFFLTAGGTTTPTSIEIRSGPKLTNCKYLRACIDEAIRLAPASLAPLWRTQSYEDQSDEPIIVDGYVIPRGTEVAVSLYSLLHNDQYFPDPFDFKPERWMEPDTPENEEAQAARTLVHDAFAPFALGARGCPGKPMLYLEDSLTIAKTIWYFDFESAPGDIGRVGEGRPGHK
ncbi:cytochrome P450 [Camillea tinctor]|nr:cytochrome P450 [Camillea tinctor]